MSELQTLLHIGYHKTGTTWLQDHLFRNAQAGFCAPFSRQREIPRHFVLPSPFAFDAQKARDFFLPPCEAAMRSGLVPVLSAERLSGNPHSGGYDVKEIADRLHEVFPQARVLIVVREQRAMILSSYKQYVRVGGTASLEDYLDPPFYRDRLPLRVPMFQWDYFDYVPLLEYYGALFGSERVLALPFEAFLRDGADFVARLAGFCGARAIAELPFEAPSNAALSSSEALLQRRFNGIAAHDSVNPHVLLRSRRVRNVVENALHRADALLPHGVKKSADAKLRRVIAQGAGHRYRESNRRLAQLTGFDLKSLGYEA